MMSETLKIVPGTNMSFFCKRSYLLVLTTTLLCPKTWLLFFKGCDMCNYFEKMLLFYFISSTQNQLTLVFFQFAFVTDFLSCFCSAVAGVPLPAKDEVIPDGSPSVVSGWGTLYSFGNSPDTLYSVEVPIVEGNKATLGTTWGIFMDLGKKFRQPGHY